MMAKEQYFPVLLFIGLNKSVLTFTSVKPKGVTIQMKATKQYFPVVLLIMLQKVVLILKLVGKIIKLLLQAVLLGSNINL